MLRKKREELLYHRTSQLKSECVSSCKAGGVLFFRKASAALLRKKKGLPSTPPTPPTPSTPPTPPTPPTVGGLTKYLKIFGIKPVIHS